MIRMTPRALCSTAIVCFLSVSVLVAAGSDYEEEGAVGPAGAGDPGVPGDPGVGPFVGHVSSDSAIVWFRPAKPGPVQLVASVGSDAVPVRVSAEALEENDRCVTFELNNLKSSTRYHYKIIQGQEVSVEGEYYYLDTAPADDHATRIALAFGSCARSKPLALWTQMDNHGIDGLVLLGDTPYIDSTDLAVARAKHAAFLAVPELARLIRHTPMWGTWDDHDFGRNDSDGTLKGKENSRQAFVEYRANASYGHGEEGIYSSLRYGPVEVFLLDTRWFARTEQSPVDAAKPTLLGAQQWDWLRRSLKQSTAPFKVIACGMIWDDKKNGESDDWGTYAYERNALFDFLGKEKITGVVLIGGDIHCSRHLRYDTQQQVGYPIHQFIISPLHNGTIPSLNVAHPNLIRGEPVPNVWLSLEIDSTKDPTTLHARWIQMEDKEMWDVRLTSEDLSAPADSDQESRQ